MLMSVTPSFLTSIFFAVQRSAVTSIFFSTTAEGPLNKVMSASPTSIWPPASLSDSTRRVRHISGSVATASTLSRLSTGRFARLGMRTLSSATRRCCIACSVLTSNRVEASTRSASCIARLIEPS